MNSPVAPPPPQTGAEQDWMEPPPRRRRYGWRLALGCLIVVLAGAGTAAVAVLEQVDTIVHDISANKALNVNSQALAQAGFGQPETFLLIGDDTRSVFKYYRGGYVPNLANEMLLVRIDPSKPWISMMSLPRELWVNVTEPNGASYQNRLNSAYTYGTTTLLRTIKRVTGLSVNHVVTTTFTQFEKAIKKLGCVYDTIDERYYHNNADGGAQYQNVNLEPGYQCLNGSDAEGFVSYRHTDTSQVRDARDQSFLLAVKQQYGPEVSGNLGKFEKVFGQTVRTDGGLRSATQILNLANLMISSQGLRVRQVPFQTMPCDGTTCPMGDLTATHQQIHDSVHNYLFGGDTTPKRQVAAFSHKLRHRHGLAHLPLTPTLSSNMAAERAAAARSPFTAEFPAVQDKGGSAIPVARHCTQVVQACIRNYAIHAPDGKAYPIYVEVFSNGNLGEYYDVQGTTWTSAPLFSHPAQTLQVGRRTYLLFYEGSHLESIAWRQYGAVYWVHNTLTNGLGNGELLAIAEQTAPVGKVRTAPEHVILKAFSVPKHAVTTGATPQIESIGRLIGLIAVALLPLALFAAVRNRRRLRALRDHVNAAALRTGLLERQMAAVAGGYALPPVPQPVAEAVRRATAGGSGPTSDPFELYRPRHRSIRAGVGMGLVVVLAAAGAYAVVESGVLKQGKARPADSLPTASVVVLNAGQVPHAAHRLGLRLTRQHVHVVATGNLRAAPPVSYEVLYRPGDAHQARLLARILKEPHPHLAPINPTTARAIGPTPRLAVVIP